jgi:hypothetical protein
MPPAEKQHFSPPHKQGISLLCPMKKTTKIDFLSGKIEIENQPLAFQLVLIIFSAAVLIILACILREGFILILLKKQAIFRAVRSLFRHA